jgi:hypothetical protein
MNEKGALRLIESFPTKPNAFSARVRNILANPGQDSALQTNVAAMDD